MVVPKYLRQYQEMIDTNKELFDTLKKTGRNSKNFSDIQLKVLRIVRRNEDALCKKTESTKFMSFSLTLADKFMEMVRANYPEIDYS